jgi:hypothetical protein
MKIYYLTTIFTLPLSKLNTITYLYFDTPESLEHYPDTKIYTIIKPIPNTYHQLHLNI